VLTFEDEKVSSLRTYTDIGDARRAVGLDS
jgi:hypothetical protein